MWRVGRSPEVKAVGASMKARKIMPPIQITRERNIRNFRNDMMGIIEGWEKNAELHGSFIRSG
jgi:hypothetical protein